MILTQRSRAFHLDNKKREVASAIPTLTLLEQASQKRLLTVRIVIGFCLSVAVTNHTGSYIERVVTTWSNILLGRLPSANHGNLRSVGKRIPESFNKRS